MSSANEKQIALEAILTEVLPKHSVSGSELQKTIVEVSEAAERSHITDAYRTSQFLQKPTRRKINTLAEAAGASIVATSAALGAAWLALQALL